MTSRNKSSSRRWRRIWSALLLLLTAFPLSRAAAQGLPLCSWPFEVTGHGLTNVATPDTNATYWVMPVDTSRWSTVIVDGRYPNARFFNLSTYQATGTLVDSMDDASIEAASGVNPFDVKLPPPKDNTLNTYRLDVAGALRSGFRGRDILCLGVNEAPNLIALLRRSHARSARSRSPHFCRAHRRTASPSVQAMTPADKPGQGADSACPFALRAGS